MIIFRIVAALLLALPCGTYLFGPLFGVSPIEMEAIKHELIRVGSFFGMGFFLVELIGLLRPIVRDLFRRPSTQELVSA